MHLILRKIEMSPAWVRVAPFIIFILLTATQGMFGEASRYWIYFAKTMVGAWMLWVVWPLISELKWKLSWEAAAVGVFVFVMWVGLDPFYPKLGQAGTAWNPHVEFGAGGYLALFFVGVRLMGSTLVVPPLEEVFYRSFLYRYLVKPDFEKVPLGLFSWTPFLVTAIVFGLTHHEWLAGILCGFAYQGLVIWKKRLGDAIMAHAITNFLLGLWVIGRGEWQFW
jgi:uncharacterized protein